MNLKAEPGNIPNWLVTYIWDVLMAVAIALRLLVCVPLLKSGIHRLT